MAFGLQPEYLTCMPDYRRILLIKPSSLGDIVHTLPALSAVRRRFPHAHITWLVKQEWAEILNGHPDLTDVIAAEFHWRWWPKLVAQLRRAKYDLVLDLQGLLRSGLLTWLTGASTRVGFAAGREGSPWWYSDRVNLPVPEVLPWRQIPMHAVDRNLVLAAHVGADITKPAFRFPDFSVEAERMKRKLRGLGVEPGEPLIAVAPVDRKRLRSWPLERFSEAALQIAEMGAGKIVLIGTAGQRDMLQPFIEKSPVGLVNLVGETTVRELAVILQRVQLLLANDSAPLHIAAALGTPVIGLFGPTSVARARPFGEGHRTLRVELPCSPCEEKICTNKNQYECLTAISVEEVVRAAQEYVQLTAKRDIS
jgi:lipopolysaccharide heptosyltransferase II